MKGSATVLTLWADGAGRPTYPHPTNESACFHSPPRFRRACFHSPNGDVARAFTPQNRCKVLK